MLEIKVETEKPYNVLIEAGLLGRASSYIQDVTSGSKLAVVTDSNVSGLYAGTLLEEFSDKEYDVKLIEFPAGEENKNLGTFGIILEELAGAGLTRGDTVIALGGGVTGDMAGFAAATYLRGISYIQVPTTYLASVDSSVGGKTAVDLRAGKNLAGAFWQPELVLIDPLTFSSLTPSEILDGSSEAFKTAMIGDPELADLVVSCARAISGDPISKVGEHADELVEVIKRSVTVKRDIVEQDERESGLRKLLNFGHTFGHAIEKLSGYAMSHGHAVARGMVCEARAAFKMGLTDNDLSGYIEEQLSSMGFDLDVPFSEEDILKAAKSDKKVRDKDFSVIVPDAPGDLKIKNLPLERMEEYIGSGL